jgi:hypothetical protein
MCVGMRMYTAYLQMYGYTYVYVCMHRHVHTLSKKGVCTDYQQANIAQANIAQANIAQQEQKRPTHDDKIKMIIHERSYNYTSPHA